ncbi:MAG: hypothetical protein WB565_18100 [Acidimicrobiales bacterium]
MTTDESVEDRLRRLEQQTGGRPVSSDPNTWAPRPSSLETWPAAAPPAPDTEWNRKQQKRILDQRAEAAAQERERLQRVAEQAAADERARLERERLWRANAPRRAAASAVLPDAEAELQLAEQALELAEDEWDTCAARVAQLRRETQE